LPENLAEPQKKTDIKKLLPDEAGVLAIIK